MRSNDRRTIEESWRSERREVESLRLMIPGVILRHFHQWYFPPPFYTTLMWHAMRRNFTPEKRLVWKPHLNHSCRDSISDLCSIEHNEKDVEYQRVVTYDTKTRVNLIVTAKDEGSLVSFTDVDGLLKYIHDNEVENGYSIMCLGKTWSIKLDTESIPVKVTGYENNEYFKLFISNNRTYLKILGVKWGKNDKLFLFLRDWEYNYTVNVQHLDGSMEVYSTRM